MCEGCSVITYSQTNAPLLTHRDETIANLGLSHLTDSELLDLANAFQNLVRKFLQHCM